MEKTHAETRGSRNDAGLAAQRAQTHTIGNTHGAEKHNGEPATCVTRTLRRVREGKVIAAQRETETQRGKNAFVRINDI